MRNTRENVCRLLEVRISNLRDLAESVKIDKPEWSKNLAYEARGLQDALAYLQNNEYFNENAEIFELR